MLFVKEKEAAAAGPGGGGVAPAPCHLHLTGNKFTERGLRHFVLKLVSVNGDSTRGSGWWVHAALNNMTEKEVHEMLNHFESNPDMTGKIDLAQSDVENRNALLHFPDIFDQRPIDSAASSA